MISSPLTGSEAPRPSSPLSGAEFWKREDVRKTCERLLKYLTQRQAEMILEYAVLSTGAPVLLEVFKDLDRGTKEALQLALQESAKENGLEK